MTFVLIAVLLFVSSYVRRVPKPMLLSIIFIGIYSCLVSRDINWPHVGDKLVCLKYYHYFFK